MQHIKEANIVYFQFQYKNNYTFNKKRKNFQPLYENKIM